MFLTVARMRPLTSMPMWLRKFVSSRASRASTRWGGSSE